MKNKKIIGVCIVIVLAITLSFVLIDSSMPLITTDTTKSDNSVRQQYFPENYQKYMFQELPPIPEDFFQRQILFITNRITFNPEILNESYWKQPEWFSVNIKNDYIERAVPTIQYNIENPGRGGIWCVGIFPRESILFSKDKKEFDVYMWIRSSPLIKKWMGIGIITEYPEDSEIEQNAISRTPALNVIQDPEYAKQNIEVIVTPSTLKLGPSFKSFHVPGDELVYYTYDYNYTEIIKIHINLSDNIEPGNYAIKLKFGSPPRELSEQWYLEHGLMYTDPIKDFNCGTEGKQSSYYIGIVVED